MPNFPPMPKPQIYSETLDILAENTNILEPTTIADRQTDSFADEQNIRRSKRFSRFCEKFDQVIAEAYAKICNTTVPQPASCIIFLYSHFDAAIRDGVIPSRIYLMQSSLCSEHIDYRSPEKSRIYGELLRLAGSDENDKQAIYNHTVTMYKQYVLPKAAAVWIKRFYVYNTDTITESNWFVKCMPESKAAMDDAYATIAQFFYQWLTEEAMLKTSENAILPEELKKAQDKASRAEAKAREQIERAKAVEKKEKALAKKERELATKTDKLERREDALLSGEKVRSLETQIQIRNEALIDNERYIRKLEKQIAELQQKIGSEPEPQQKMQEETCKETERDLISVDDAYNGKYLFVMDPPNGKEATTYQAIERSFPNSKISYTIDSITGAYERVIILTKYMSHPLYYSIKTACDRANVPYIQSDSQNVGVIAKDIADAINQTLRKETANG